MFMLTFITLTSGGLCFGYFLHNRTIYRICKEYVQTVGHSETAIFLARLKVLCLQYTNQYAVVNC